MPDKDIEQEVKDRVDEEEENFPSPAITNEELDSDFIRQCFDLNLRGDGILYAVLNRDKFIFNQASGQWLAWQGHHWALDLNNQQALNAVWGVAIKYESIRKTITEDLSKARAAENEALVKTLTNKRNAINTRIRGLHGNRAKDCLTWATIVDGGLSVKGDNFDRIPYLLSAQNGVVDLRSGKFRDGRQEDWLTKVVPYDLDPKYWEKDCIDEDFENFLTSSLAPPKEHKAPDLYLTNVIAYLRRLLGYAITGYRSENVFPIFVGDKAQNGKGTMVHLFYQLLGPMSKPISGEMLLKQKYSRSSAGPSPDLMELYGLRLGCASETEQGREFSMSECKRLAGGDKITARSPNDKYPICFDQTHLLLLITNHLPKADSDDPGFWYRVAIIRFHWSFVAKPTKPHEKKRLKDIDKILEKKAPQILGWIIRGSLEWHQKGLAPPEEVQEEVKQYRSNQDDVGQWIEGRCNTDDPTVKKHFKELYDPFAKWYKEFKGDHVISKTRFSNTLVKKGFLREKTSNVYFYGISVPLYLDD